MVLVWKILLHALTRRYKMTLQFKIQCHTEFPWLYRFISVSFQDCEPSKGAICKSNWKWRWYIKLREKCPYSEFFWSSFSLIKTEYGEIRSISLYSVWIRENANQKISEYGHFSRSVNDLTFTPQKQILAINPLMHNIVKWPNIL